MAECDLKCDLNEFEKAKSQFKDSIDEFCEIKCTILNELCILQCDAWKSKAGQAFFDNYEGKWCKNLEQHIETLKILIELLEIAVREYGELMEKAKAIRLEV